MGDTPEEFLEHTRLELFQDQVFCFTPKGRLIALPRGISGGFLMMDLIWSTYRFWAAGFAIVAMAVARLAGPGGDEATADRTRELQVVLERAEQGAAGVIHHLLQQKHVGPQGPEFATDGSGARGPAQHLGGQPVVVLLHKARVAKVDVIVGQNVEGHDSHGVFYFLCSA